MRSSSLALVLLCAAAMPAAADDDDGCTTIHAVIDLTHGTISGNFHLDGTVAFVADSAGTPPATAPAKASVFSGLLTVTTPHGNLVLRETGMFSSRTGNPAGPILASWGEALSGSEDFTGVTGDVFFAGLRAGSIFAVQVSGTLCRPAGD